MNGRERINELFDKLSKTPSFVTDNRMKDLIERRGGKGRFQPSIYPLQFPMSIMVWAMAGIGILAVGIFLILHFTFQDRNPDQRFDHSIVVKQADSVHAIMPAGSDTSRTSGNPQETISATPITTQYSPNWVPKRIEALRWFELDTAQLIKLGIYVRPYGLIYWVTGNSFWLRCEDDVSLRHSPSEATMLSGRFLEFEKNTLDAKLITDGNGRKYFDKSKGSDRNGMLDAAIPILLDLKRTCASECSHLGRYFIFWYEYSDGLLDLLPVSMKNEIQSDRLKQVKNPGAGSQNDKLLVNVRISRETKSAIVEYRRGDAEEVSFTLYDIRGALMESVMAGKPSGKDISSAIVPMDKLLPGIYLLAVRNSKGESVVRRLCAD